MNMWTFQFDVFSPDTAAALCACGIDVNVNNIYIIEFKAISLHSGLIALHSGLVSFDFDLQYEYKV